MITKMYGKLRKLS